MEFILSEFVFEEYEGLKIEAKTAKKQGEELIGKSKQLVEVQKVYENIISTYRAADWSLAALFRIGSLYDDLQAAIFTAPCPKDVEAIDEIACEEYGIMLEDRAFAIEDKASRHTGPLMKRV